MPEPAALEVEHLRKVFRVREPGKRARTEIVAVEDVSFSLRKGERSRSSESPAPARRPRRG